MNKVRNYQKELDQIIEGMCKGEKCADRKSVV